MILAETYHITLVVVSILTAIGSSFVALSTVPRIHSAISSKHSFAWIAIFGLSLGAGIWAMHFIAILALQLPIPVHFDITLTIFSLLLAVGVTAVAISPLRSGGSLHLFSPKTLFIGIMMGLGIAGMHYSGMAAMRLNATMQHHSHIILLAVVIAIVASTAALLIANQLRDTRIFNQLGVKTMAAIVMGFAVSAMHYTAMYGMDFIASDTLIHFESVIDPLILAIFIIIIAFLIQGGIIIGALFDEAYAMSEETASEMKRRADISKALSDILSVAMHKQSLESMMERVLDIILSVEWLALEKKGSIFISDSRTNTLSMLTQQHLHPELLKQCKKIPFGHCLCGKAAETRNLIYKNCIDHEHVIRVDGMTEHGHYCIPVMSQGEVLAVINLYLSPDHQQSAEEISFLSTVADAVAPMILNHRLEAKSLKISSAIDQAGEAVLISNYNGLIEYVNKAFTEITGYSMQEALGQKPSILKSGNQDQLFYKQMWDTIKSGEVWQGEVIERRKDGSFYPAMLTISPIRDSEDKITHFVGIHEDLSEHKSLEAQYRQAQKMEALGTLVGGIAHDFNNMLAGMIGNLYIIKGKVKENPDILEKVERVEKVGFQAADMIKQMLVFARNDDVERHKLSLSSFIKEAFNLHQIVIPENIQLNRNISGSNLFVLGNPAMLQQLLLNLVGNAADALAGVENPTINFSLNELRGSEELCLKHAKAKAHSNYAYIHISDNGAGIEAEHIEHIFDPFFTTKEVGKGTGLGLAMTATIISSHNGFVEVESEPGRGTDFHIYIPLCNHEEQKPLAADSAMIADSKGETLLIVDDDETLRDTTAETLQLLGYRTLVASNGRDAVEIFQATAVDAVILDVVMPVMGGPDTAREMLNLNPHTNIIFATGYDRENALKDAKDLENTPVLSKPFEINELHRTIRLLLD
ncbi:blue-light-activated protein [Mariprofundus micogutta]|uniref:histidine kinase n=1 Tax=Mariprofundus micogutta TaxID=1921010 RepID=A0A1L8CPD6_9PROT|nr:MHYT domain-containing protein [Mariprofundus micogutta]GAV20785.1 blue-light-activated protein [Mariprofundus micogutta]